MFSDSDFTFIKINALIMIIIMLINF